MKLTADVQRAHGQVSLEFLVLFAAFLGILALWAPMAAKFKGQMEGGLGAVQMRGAAARLGDAADSVCLMGRGNVREVGLGLSSGSGNDAGGSGGAGAGGSGAGMKIEVRGKKLFIYDDAHAVSVDMRCEGVDAVLDGVGGAEPVFVWWEDGKVAVGTIKADAS